jgi:hypothetical protein
MSRELLGESFDIHGGGIDLQFPHHENEIAQSRCAHPDGDFARVWMHNEMVQVEGKKMSKSLGNFFTVRDLLDQGWPGEVIRFVMLRRITASRWTGRRRRRERLYLYDTTLRDGQQTQGVQFSVADKRAIAEMLDALGVDYIEGGWPGANPTDSDVLRRGPAHPRHLHRLRHDQARRPFGGQ